MGALGADTMQAVYERLKQQAEEFRAVDLEREVKEAFHLVYAVAQASAGDDGLFLDHTDGDLVQAFIDFTRDRDMLLILDLQNGHADLEAEVIGVLPYLSERHVHLALDPEFTMVSGEASGYQYR